MHAVSFLNQNLFLIKYLMSVQHKLDWVQLEQNTLTE